MLQRPPLPPPLPACFGPDGAAPADSPPPRKAKKRFDIESLLATPEPPRRAPRVPGVWPTAPPPALSFGCVAGMLPFPTVYLAEPLPLPPRPCAHPGCKRPEFSHCAAPSSLGAPFSWRPRGGCKLKRVRTVFTPDQLERLEKAFLKQQYMVGTERVDLAATLHLTETQVKVWFQNRRIKWRKQSLEQKAAKLSRFGAMQASPPGRTEGKGRDEVEVDVEV